MNEQTMNMMQADPLFKIIFRDELTSRKYRRRVEDIINYVMTTELNEDPGKNYDTSSNLVLEVYDPVELNQCTENLEHIQSLNNTSQEIINNQPKKRKLEEQELILHIKSEKNIEDQKSPMPIPQSTEYETQNIAHYTPEPAPMSNEKLKKHNHHHFEETNTFQNQHDFMLKPQIDRPKRHKLEPVQLSFNSQSINDPVPEPQIKKLKKDKTQQIQHPLPTRSPQLVPDVRPELNFLQVRNKLETAFKNMISLKIGISDYFIKDKNVYFSNETGLTIKSKADDQIELIQIRLDEIVKILVHLPKVKPSIFIFITPEAMRRTQLAARINEANEPYVDLRIKDMIHNCITVLPDLINTKANNILRQIFKNTEVLDINDSNAKNILDIIPAVGSKGHGKSSARDRTYKNFIEKCAKFLPKIENQPIAQSNVYDHKSKDPWSKMKEKNKNKPLENINISQPMYQEHYTPPLSQSQYQQLQTQHQQPLPPPQPQHQQLTQLPQQQLIAPPLLHQLNNVEVPAQTESNTPVYEAAEAIFCRVIRVGSHEYAKKRMFSITKSSIKFCVPHPRSSAMITLSIKLYDITKISIGSSKNLPVLFIYIYPKVAEEIRSVLMMTDPNGPYIDPLSRDETHNKIIILPERTLNNNRLLEKLSSQGKIENLDESTTNNILSRSLPSNIDLFHKLSKKVKKQKIKEEKVEITLK